MIGEDSFGFYGISIGKDNGTVVADIKNVCQRF